MAHAWDLRCSPARGLIEPVPIDPTGWGGPTRAQAYGPRWRRVARGLFVPSIVERSVEQRILEASRHLPPGGAVTGWAALRLYGVNFCDGLSSGRELPVPLACPFHVRASPEIVAHRVALEPHEIVRRQATPVATAVRAAFEAARWAEDLRAAVTVIDMATSAGATSLAELRTFVETRAGARGSRRVASALALACDRTKSPRESQMRLIWVLDAGLPTPLCNWPIAALNGRRLGEPDLLSLEHDVVGEYDGAEHRGRLRHRKDEQRADDFTTAGLERFVLVGADVMDVRLAVGRMRAAVQRAAERPRERRWMLHAHPKPVA